MSSKTLYFVAQQHALGGEVEKIAGPYQSYEEAANRLEFTKGCLHGQWQEISCGLWYQYKETFLCVKRDVILKEP